MTAKEQGRGMLRVWMIALVAVVALAAVMLFSAPAQAAQVNVPLDDSLTDIHKCGTVCQDAPSSFTCSAQCQMRRPDGGFLAEITVSTSGSSTPNNCLSTLRTACRNLLQ